MDHRHTGEIDIRKIPVVLDGENEPDFTNVRICPKCSSPNISVDLSTNKSFCPVCNETISEIKRINFKQHVDKVVERDGLELQKLMLKGDKISLE